VVELQPGGAYEEKKQARSTSFDTRKLTNTDPEIEVHKPFAVSKAADHWESKLAKEYTTTDVYSLQSSDC